MKKWFTRLKQAFLRSDNKEFYYAEELRKFEEQENLRRTQYLSSFSKAA